ncbi:MAG: folate-binding protein [Rhodomicrobium sp.]|nr:MAG: folate-binding protein [Rhodomicrobium sp.]
MTNLVALVDRGLIRVTGEEASPFLQSLVTNDVTKAEADKAVFAGLLTPQGKINYEFFIVPVEGGYLLETGRGCADDLVKKLKLYKMRADVRIDNLSDETMTFWLASAPETTEGLFACYRDPRYEKMGYRIAVTLEGMKAFCSSFDACEIDYYHLTRLQYAVPEGGYDYAFGDTFPHEAGYDLLNGVDFSKGCYVGQEVVSRMQHRGTARRRVVLVSSLSDQALPEAGSEIRTETSLMGPLGSSLKGQGIALVRLDRASKAMASGNVMKAGDVPVTLTVPPWANYSLEVEEA